MVLQEVWITSPSALTPSSSAKQAWGEGRKLHVVLHARRKRERAHFGYVQGIDVANKPTLMLGMTREAAMTTASGRMLPH